jgi:hypothetical protein
MLLCLHGPEAWHHRRHRSCAVHAQSKRMSKRETLSHHRSMLGERGVRNPKRVVKPYVLLLYVKGGPHKRSVSDENGPYFQRQTFYETHLY